MTRLELEMARVQRQIEQDQQPKNSGGIDYFTILGLIFIVLKLTKVINWSWWWVTLPIWGGFVFVVLLNVIIKVYINYQNTKYE